MDENSSCNESQALCSHTTTSRALNRRLQGWALELQDFAFIISYREGPLNADADAMSRKAWQPYPSSGDDASDSRTASSAGGCVRPELHKENYGENREERWEERGTENNK